MHHLDVVIGLSRLTLHHIKSNIRLETRVLDILMYTGCDEAPLKVGISSSHFNLTGQLLRWVPQIEICLSVRASFQNGILI